MGQEPNTPGERLVALAASELEALAELLRRVERGEDRAVHRARKSVQRLRAVVRLCAPLDASGCERVNRDLRRLRRRLGPLRDAAARRQTLLLLASRPRWREHRAALRGLAARESERRAAAWERFQADPTLRARLASDLAQVRRGIARLPLAQVDASCVQQALTAALKAARRRIRAGRGAHARTLRHELRRKLRRLATVRRAAAAVLLEDAAAAERLLDLGKRCGHEGDLWMALECARLAAREDASLRPLVRALEAQRRLLCRRHDRLLLRTELA